MSGISRQASDVRINELDLSSTLTANSSITAATVIVSSRGPVKATYQTQLQSFYSRYGVGSAKVSFDHLCVKDYFDEGAGIWVKRAVNTDARTSALCIYQAADGQTHIDPVNAGLVDTDNIDWSVVAPLGATPLYVVYPLDGPGSYANSDYGVSLVSNNLAKVVTTGVDSSTTGGFLPAGSYSYQVSAFSSNGEYLASTPAAITIVATGSNCTATVNWTPIEGAAGYYIYGRINDGVAPYGYLATVGAGNTSWTDDGLTVPDVTRQPINATSGLTSPSPYFTLKVWVKSVNLSSPQETWDCSLHDELDGQGLQMEAAERINSYSNLVGIASNVPNLLQTPSLKSAASAYMAGGTAGSAPTTAQIIAAQETFLDKAKYIIDVLTNNGKSVIPIQQSLDAIATKRSDCIAFLDVPAAKQSFQKALDYRNVELNLNSSYSALFCSDLLKFDRNSGKNTFVPPSGSMAALLARTTRVGQPWFSMAGLNRGLTGAMDVRYTYDDAQATMLFQSQINYMRKFLGQGIPLWEQTTQLAKSSALQYINVRVLSNVIKRSVYSYLLYTLQEQTTDELMKTISDNLNTYLDTVKAGDGIRQESRAYCNRNTTTDLDLNQGVTRVVVYIVPILANRAIAVTLAVGKTGLTISETDVSAQG